MEREARKATKRANRKDSTKSLQEFLQSDSNKAVCSSNTTPPSLTPPSLTPPSLTPPSLTPHKVEHKVVPTEASELHDAEPVSLEGTPLMDPGMGGAVAEGTISDTSYEVPRGSNEQQNPVLEPYKETGNEAYALPAGRVVSEYASSGPQPDLKVYHSKPGREEMLLAKKNLAALAHVDSQVGATKNEEGSGEDIAAGAGVSTEVEVGYVQSKMTDAPNMFEANSLHMLLEQFCATEHLTHDNKFACTHCTKMLAEEEERRCVSGTDEGNERDEVSPPCGDNAMGLVGDGGGVLVAQGGNSSGEEECSDEGMTALFEDRGITREQSSVESEG